MALKKHPKRVTGGRHKEGELLASRIRASILSGEHAIGDSLGQERDLLERFAVSRPTLREACRILEAESLIRVERGTGGGIRVQRPDGDLLARYARVLLRYNRTTLRDVWECRAIIEPAVARRVAEERPVEAGTELNRVLEKAEAQDSIPSWTRVAGNFHVRLVELSGNRTLTFLTRLLDDILAPSVTAGLDQARDPESAGLAIERSSRSLRKVARLIAEGRGQAAAALLERHIEGARDVLLSSLGPNALVECRESAGPGRAPKVADIVAEHFRTQIATGVLREGDALPPVAEIQREMDISRPSLVEGLRILESQGLIQTRLGATGGAIVHAPNVGKAAHYASLVLSLEEPIQLSDLLWAERVLEPPAVRLLVERATDDDVAVLIEAREKVRSQAAAAADDAGLVTASFRRTLMGLSKNETLGLLASLVGRLIRAAHEEMYKLQVDRERGMRVLETLTNLVELRQAEAAEIFWRQHLEKLALTVSDQGADTRLLRPPLDGGS